MEPTQCLQVLTGVTDAGGALTVNGEIALPGRILYSVEFVLGTLTSGAATITLQDVGVSGITTTYLTLTNPTGNGVYNIRTTDHSATGTAGTQSVLYAIRGKLKMTIASGGNAKQGYMYIYYL